MAAMLAAPGLRDRPLVFTTHGLHRLRRSTGARRLARAAAPAGGGGGLVADDLHRPATSARTSPRSLPAVASRAARRGRQRRPGPATAQPRGSGRERARALGSATSEVGVLFVGQLEERKDPLGAIAPSRRRGRGGAELVLLLAGDGPLERQVARARRAGVRPLGHREDLADLYAAADLFLLPSHREGMSFALLEAMAHGLAPVVADGAGNAETVGEAGRRLPGRRPRRRWPRCLAELAADPEDRARLGAAARERIRAELSLEHFLARGPVSSRAIARLGAALTPQGS